MLQPHLPKVLALSLFALLPFHLLHAETSNIPLKEALFAPETPQEFKQALTKATKLNTPRQTLLEARFLFYVDQADYPALAKLSTELQEFDKSFSPENSEIFTLQEDWSAIVMYTKSLAALEQGNEALFKEYITEAFWLSPRQASAFAPHIEKLKLDKAMRNVTLQFDEKLPSLVDKSPSLVLSKNSTANILYFWSPWSREFAQTLEEFKSIASLAKQHNIHVTAILAELSPEVEVDAKKFLNEFSLTDKARWLTENNAMTLSAQLRVQSIPTVVIVSKSGKISFNGSPDSKEFTKQIKKITPPPKPSNK